MFISTSLTSWLPIAFNLDDTRYVSRFHVAQGPNARLTTALRLSPIRQHALFYLCATSLATKRPLPSEIPSMSIVLHGITHDALVISARLWNRSDSPASKITTGRDIIKSPNFLRYWFYLSSYSTVGDTLEKLEVDLRAMFSSNDGY